MSRFMKTAIWLFVLSALVAVGNWWTTQAFPDAWGGPNIGAGVIQLLAYLGLVIGAVFLVVAVSRRRQAR